MSEETSRSFDSRQGSRDTADKLADVVTSWMVKANAPEYVELGQKRVWISTGEIEDVPALIFERGEPRSKTEGPSRILTSEDVVLRFHDISGLDVLMERLSDLRERMTGQASPENGSSPQSKDSP